MSNEASEYVTIINVAYIRKYNINVTTTKNWVPLRVVAELNDDRISTIQNEID